MRKFYTRIAFFLVAISFLGSVFWFFYSDYKAKNIQKRFSDTIVNIYKDIEQKGAKFSFIGDSLVAWTDNTIVITEQQCRKLTNEWQNRIIVELRNGFFLHQSSNSDDTLQTHYLYLIKYNYDIENRYLKNVFSDDFALDDNIEIVDYETDFPIYFQGERICYLEVSPECLKRNSKDVFILKLWLLLNFFVVGVLIINNRYINLLLQRRLFKLQYKILMLSIVVILYAFVCSRIVIENSIFDINFDTAFSLAFVVLLGFFIFLFANKIFAIKKPRMGSQPQKSKKLVIQFVVLLSISIIAGVFLQYANYKYSSQNKTLSIENLGLNDKSQNIKNFHMLMEASVQDSLINNYVLTKNYSKAEKHIEKYYLALLNSSNHTSVLIFDEKDSITLQPGNKKTQILSYTQNRLINSRKLDSLQNLYEQTNYYDNNTYIYYNKRNNVYFFAECLQKTNNKNMNYSLFLEQSPTLFNSFATKINYSLYLLLSKISLVFFVLCILFGTYKLVASLPQFRQKTLSIKSKILVSLLGSFVVSLIISGIFAIGSVINSNKQNNENILHEKTQTIALEIGKILEMKDEITNLDLINLSNTFLTDISIFDFSGNLVVCSQEDIFNRGVISAKINPVALKTIYNNTDTLFYQQEKICEGSFLASYISVMDNQTDTYYIINIPFINQQKIMNDNINDLVNNFANMFLFWVNVAILIFVFLSNIITKPLELIKEKMGRINVNIHNDKILWEQNDEMGELIKAYNMMIDKIEESTFLLKQQERTASWRELAKQVAHDIKNPLTPMKLSIQYLLHLYDKKQSGDNEANILFETKWKDIAPSLISQIESISTITQELNSYSKPFTKKEKVNLDESIRAAINLFTNINDVQIEYFPLTNAFTMGEEALFIRIFNNLIKNSLQALYNKTDGRISISIKDNENKYIVSIEDNGCGIKEENKDKIFNTQFTTKENGNGIGLTIVKTLLENYDAQISFHSKENVGTVFFIAFDKI